MPAKLKTSASYQRVHVLVDPIITEFAEELLASLCRQKCECIYNIRRGERASDAQSAVHVHRALYYDAEANIRDNAVILYITINDLSSPRSWA
jgi:hypothetical protein